MRLVFFFAVPITAYRNNKPAEASFPLFPLISIEQMCFLMLLGIRLLVEEILVQVKDLNIHLFIPCVAHDAHIAPRLQFGTY